MRSICWDSKNLSSDPDGRFNKLCCKNNSSDLLRGKSSRGSASSCTGILGAEDGTGEACGTSSLGSLGSNS